MTLQLRGTLYFKNDKALETARRAHDKEVARWGRCLSFGGFDEQKLCFSPGEHIQGTLSLPSGEQRSTPTLKILRALAAKAISGRLFITGSPEGTVAIYPKGGVGRELSFEPRAAFEVTDYPVLDGLSNELDPWRSLAFSPNGTRLVLSGGGNFGDADAGFARGFLLLVDAATGSSIGRFHGHRYSVPGVAFSADGARLLSGSWRGTLILWDAQTGEPLKEKKADVHKQLDGYDADISHVAPLPGGRWLTLGGGGIALWSAELKPLANATAHTTWTRSLVVSHDGTRAISIGYDRRLIAWNLQPKLARLGELEGPFVSAALLTDGRIVAIDAKAEGKDPRDPPRERGWAAPSYPKDLVFFSATLEETGRRPAEGNPQQVLALPDRAFVSVGRDDESTLRARTHDAAGALVDAADIETGGARVDDVVALARSGSALAVLTGRSVFLLRSRAS